MATSSLSRLLRLQSPPFSFPFTTSSITTVEKLYSHLLNNPLNPEKTLALSPAKLDARLVTGVLHRCRTDKNDKTHLGLRFFFWAGLQPGYRHSRYMYGLVCRLFEVGNKPGSVQEVLEGWRVAGFVGSVKLFKVVLNLCREVGLADQGLWLLREMEVGFGCRPDSTMFNVVIRLFCEKGEIEKAVGLLEEMERRGLCPDMISFMLVLKGLCDLGRLEEGCGLFKVMRKNGCTPNLVAYSALLDGLCKAGAFEKVGELLEEMEKEGGECVPNVITYTSIIHRFCEKGKAMEAVYVLDRMERSKCSPNRVTMSVLIQGLCNGGYIDEAYKLIDRIVAEGRVSSGECYSSLVIALLRNKRLDEGEKLFRWMLGNAIRPDGLACNTLLKELCSEGKFRDAFKLYEEVEQAGLTLSMDTDVFFTLLTGLCEQNHEIEVAQLVSLMVGKGIAIEAPYVQAIKEKLKGSVDLDSLSKLCKMEISE